MPLALAAFMSVTWAATEPNGCGAAGAGSSTMEKLAFQLQPDTSWDIVYVFWATARAADDPCQPGIPQLNPFHPAFIWNHQWANLLWDRSRIGISVVQNKAGASTQDQGDHALPGWRSFMVAGAKLAQTHHNNGVYPHLLAPIQGRMPRGPKNSYCFHISTRAHLHKRRKFSRGYLDSRVLPSIGDFL